MSDSPASRMLQNLQSAAQPVSQQWLQPSSSGQTQTPSQIDPPQVQPSPDTIPDTVPQQAPVISDQQKLATFEAILSEMDEEKRMSGEPPADLPSDDAPSHSQPVAYTSTGVRKEQAPTVLTSELPGGMQYVESEPANPEIPEEVESFLQKVEEDTINLPHEIVIAAEQHAAAATQRQLPQDVKVLPITAAQAEAAEKKNTSFSIKWLLKFSEKLIQIFKGQAVYRPE